jgi:hypothetical protein
MWIFIDVPNKNIIQISPERVALWSTGQTGGHEENLLYSLQCKLTLENYVVAEAVIQEKNLFAWVPVGC